MQTGLVENGLYLLIRHASSHKLLTKPLADQRFEIHVESIDVSSTSPSLSITRAKREQWRDTARVGNRLHLSLPETVLARMNQEHGWHWARNFVLSTPSLPIVSETLSIPNCIPKPDGRHVIRLEAQRYDGTSPRNLRSKFLGLHTLPLLPFFKLSGVSIKVVANVYFSGCSNAVK